MYHTDCMTQRWLLPTKIFFNRQRYFSEPDCLDVALLLGAVLQEGVHQLGVDEVAGVEAVEDVVSAVVRDAAQDGEAGHQHRVVVVAERAVLDEADQRVEAAQGEQLSAHRGVRAESEEIFRLEMLRQNNMIIIVMNNGLQNAGPTAILSLIVLQTKAIRRFVITEIIAFVSKFYIYLLWGQRPFSIVS